MVEVYQVDIVNVKFKYLFEYSKKAPQVTQVLRECGANVYGPFMTETGGTQPEVVYITKWSSVDEMQEKRKAMMNHCEMRKLWDTLMPLVLTSQNFLCLKDDRVETFKPHESSQILMEHISWVGSPIDGLNLLRDRLKLFSQKNPELVRVIALLNPITYAQPGFFVLLEVKDGNLNKMIEVFKMMNECEEMKKMATEDGKYLTKQSVRLLSPIQRMFPEK